MKEKKKSQEHSYSRYVPLMDWWIALFVAFLLIGLLVAIPTIVWSNLPLLPTILGLVIVIITILYIVDLVFFTAYHLEENGLAIVSQFRRIFFPYRTLQEIQNGNIFGLLSLGKKKRFSLSHKCLKIRLVNSSWEYITVSPKKRQEFVHELLHNIDQERSERAALSD